VNSNAAKDFPVMESTSLSCAWPELDCSLRFYQGVFGAAACRECGGTSCVLQFQGTPILLVTGGVPILDVVSVTQSESVTSLFL
jgi:hypothetical protein